MLLADLVACAGAVAATSARTAKIESLAELLRDAGGHEAGVVAALVAGDPRHGRVGVGWATVATLQTDPASDPTLTVAELDSMLSEVADASGDGSAQRRLDVLEEVADVVRSLPGHVRRRSRHHRRGPRPALGFDRIYRLRIMTGTVSIATDTGPETTPTPGTSTITEPDIRPVTDDGDHDRFAHYTRRADANRAYVEGTPVRALCGKVWVPSRDPSRYPVCPECAKIRERLRRRAFN